MDRLKTELESIGAHSTEQSVASRNISLESGVGVGVGTSDAYTFTRTVDLLAGFYKVRTQLWQAQDFSGQRRVKYELWRVETPHPQLLLILMQNINIRQTLEDFTSKICDLPKDLKDFRELTVLRPTPGKADYLAVPQSERAASCAEGDVSFHRSPQIH